MKLLGKGSSGKKLDIQLLDFNENSDESNSGIKLGERPQ